jgi:ribose-phosphate pyrophosphokinase
MSQENPILLFSGTSHPALAREVAEYLGVDLGNVSISRFPDGEIALQIQESVRGRDVFVIQSIALDPNNYLMELLIMVDSFRRASAQSITAVIPYYGYARQDRKDQPRVPITAKLVANLLVNAGVTRVLTMDLHTDQLQGFFDIPVDNLYGRPQLAEAISQRVNADNLTVVTPDMGSVKLAHAYAKHLKSGFAVVDKIRIDPTRVEALMVIGDIKGKDVLLADDMCSTGATLVSAAKACREKGAKRIFAAVTHGIFVGDAVKLIEESPIEMVLMSNTVPQTNRLRGTTKIQTISVASLFAQAIHCIVQRKSISSFYKFETA